MLRASVAVFGITAGTGNGGGAGGAGGGTGGACCVPPGTSTSLWHFGQRKVCPARLSETISECPEGHLIRSGMGSSSKKGRHMPTLSVCSLFASWSIRRP